MICHRKHQFLEHVFEHENFLHDIIERKMMEKATWHGKMMKLLYDIMQKRDCGQLKHAISD